MNRSAAIGIYNEKIKPHYQMQADGSIKKTRVRKDLGERLKELYSQYSVVWGDSVTESDFTAAIMEFVEDDALSPTEDGGCTSLSDALDEFMQEIGLTVQYDQIRYRESGRLASPDTLKAVMSGWCWERNLSLTKHDTKYPKTELIDAFQARQEELAQNRWLAIGDDLRYRKHPTGLRNELRKILQAIGCSEERHDVDMTMLAHWMWCVKRKVLLNDYRPALPLMVVLAGVQGCGKSSFIEQWLTLPFRDKTINTTLDMIHDKREIEKFTQNMVINFDELATKDKKGETPELLKNLITLGHVLSRVMGTTIQQKMEILANFTATTNRHLSEVVRDETGARRYWVFETGPVSEGQFDWTVLETIDWVALWKGIDENRQRGYLLPESELYPQIQEVQNTYCISPIVRDWLYENYQPLAPEYKELLELTKLELDKKGVEELPTGLHLTTPSALYELYVDDMKARDIYTCSPTAFNRMLEKMGVGSVRQSKRYNTPYYVLQKRSDLDREEEANDE